MKSVRISIVIPVYNAEGHLDKCLSSIVGQDMLSYEVILVDDGSTDSSPLICERYSATDPRFKTITKPNGGVSSARNAGLNVADGEYVMFVDADDALTPGALSTLDAATAGFPDFVLGGFNVYEEDMFFGESVPVRSAGMMDSFLADTMSGTEPFTVDHGASCTGIPSFAGTGCSSMKASAMLRISCSYTISLTMLHLRRRSMFLYTNISVVQVR